MWPQPGCRQGYAEGEVGEGVLKGGSASKKIAGFGERNGTRRRSKSSPTEKEMSSSLPELTLLVP